MNIYIVYKRYKSLHSKYNALLSLENAQQDISFSKEKVLPGKIKKLFPIYRKLKTFSVSNSILYKKLIFFLTGDYTKKTNVDLYYFASTAPIKIPNKPFIIDVEHVWALFDFIQPSKRDLEKTKKILLNNNCIALLTWSKAAKKTVFKVYPELRSRIDKKIKVIYPAQELILGRYKPSFKLIRKTDKIKFLFIGIEYRRKGLLEVLSALENLPEEILSLLELTIVTHLDSFLVKRIDRLNKSLKINLFEARFNKEELIRFFYLTHDVFLFPTHHDTFGMVILEALASGLPVITTDQFATKEIIRDGYNGVLLKHDYPNKELLLDKKIFHQFRFDKNFSQLDQLLIKEISGSITSLISNPKKLNYLKSNTTKEFLPGGKFSIERFNKIMEKLLKFS